jgi:hypothetical protein
MIKFFVYQVYGYVNSYMGIAKTFGLYQNQEDAQERCNKLEKRYEKLRKLQDLKDEYYYDLNQRNDVISFISDFKNLKFAYENAVKKEDRDIIKLKKEILKSKIEKEIGISYKEFKRVRRLAKPILDISFQIKPIPIK